MSTHHQFLGGALFVMVVPILSVTACSEPLNEEALRCSSVEIDQDFHPAEGTLHLMMKEGPPPSEAWLLAVQTTYGAKVNGCAFSEGVERWTVSLDFALPSSITTETQVNSSGYDAPYFVGAVGIRDASGDPEQAFTFGGILKPGGEVLVQEYSRDTRTLRATARGYFDFDIDIDWTAEALVSTPEE